jgi:hypothetical protein
VEFSITMPSAVHRSAFKRSMSPGNRISGEPACLGESVMKVRRASTSAPNSPSPTIGSISMAIS